MAELRTVFLISSLFTDPSFWIIPRRMFHFHRIQHGRAFPDGLFTEIVYRVAAIKSLR